MRQQKYKGAKKDAAQGFTLMEIITVLVVIGIITAIAIPNFIKAYERSLSRKARLDLIAIHSAMEIYRAKNGDTPDTGGFQDISYINNLLFDANHQINNNNFVIQLESEHGNIFTATATRAKTGTLLTVTQGKIDETNPSCSSGICP